MMEALIVVLILAVLPIAIGTIYLAWMVLAEGIGNLWDRFEESISRVIGVVIMLGLMVSIAIVIDTLV
jgi:hypothetical protein